MTSARVPARQPSRAAVLHLVGPALRELRQRRRLSQAELARRAGVTKAMASNYERGQRRPSLRSLVALLHALGADFGHLQQAIRFVSRSPRHRNPSN